VNQYNLELEQMDVKTTFLKEDFEKSIYVEQIEGFMKDKSKVFLLNKLLYG
jgi:hypothetical protein